MLLWQTNNQFASENNPERERLLACFADDGNTSGGNGADAQRSDDDQQDPGEQTDFEELLDNEVGRREKHPDDDARRGIEGVSKSMKWKTEELELLLEQGVASSMAILSFVEGLLDDREIRDSIQNKEKLQTLVDRHGEELLAGRVDTQVSRELQPLLREFTRNPVVALRVTQALEQRVMLYGEIERRVGTKNLDKLSAFEKQLQIDARMDAKTPEEKQRREDARKKLAMLANPTAWSDEELRKIFTSLGVEIDEKDFTFKASGELNSEQEATLKAINEQYAIEAIDEKDRDSQGNPTHWYKLKRLKKLLTDVRWGAKREKEDLGTETTATSFNEVNERMMKQLLHARRHLRRLIREKASVLEKQVYEKKLYELRVEYGTAEGQNKIIEEFGISPSAFYTAISEASAPISQALEKAKRLTQRADGSIEQIVDEGNLKKITDSAFALDAERILNQLDNLEWMTEVDDEKALVEKLVGRERKDHEEAVEWARDIGPRLHNALSKVEQDPALKDEVHRIIESSKGPTDMDALLKTLGEIGDSLLPFSEGNASPDLHDMLRQDITIPRRQQIESMVRNFEQQKLRRELFAKADTLERKQRAFLEQGTVSSDEYIERLESTAEHLRESLLPKGKLCMALDHEVSEGLHVREQLGKKFEKIAEKLESAHTHAHLGKSGISDDLVSAGGDVELLQELLHESTKVHPIASEGFEKTVHGVHNDEWKQITGFTTDNGKGYFNVDDGQTYINIDNVTDQGTYDWVCHHERGHAIVHLLMWKTAVFPGLLIGSLRAIEEKAPEDSGGRTFREILLAQAERYKIQRREGESEEDHLVHLLDELWNRHASWIQLDRPSRLDGPPIKKDEYQLFKMLDSMGHIERKKNKLASVPKDPTALRRGMVNHPAAQSKAAPDDDEDLMAQLAAANAGAEDDDAPERPKGFRDLNEEIVERRRDLTKIKSYLDGHPQLQNRSDLQAFYDECKNYLKQDIEKPFHSKEGMSDQEASDRLRNLRDYLKPVIDDIELQKQRELDLSRAPAEGREGVRAFLDCFNMVSVMDIINMVKSGAEDIQRMWKRRGDRVQSGLGKLLTGWIHDNKYWFGLEYAGQLKHEYERRSHASELEEVKQWKDALENEDSFQLQAMLKVTRNKDQVRAIIELLVDRGRMDWNDENLWDTLNYLSNYRMPKEACKVDDILRDRWLQKLVTDIWDDAEHYYNWRQSNDSNFKSGKDKFTDTADQFSNVQGGLDQALERMLRMWTLAKANHEEIPEEVNPHLYEEIIHYAIRNGKMSMEGKLYYIVQGVASKLLSIDRLRTLAGENGGVLNLFPFIDYFYNKNNSYPEVKALAERLQEDTSDPKKRFKPGSKTTLWLHLELTRNERARERMSKATSGLRAESLDHEDIPTLVAQFDYKGIDRMTGVISGSREKLSPEAVRNTYTGFGTKFKVLARLAQMEDEGVASFTNQDVFEAARSITSYIHMDNIFTKNASDGKNERPELTFTEINTSQAVSSNGLFVKEFRDSNNDFVLDILNNFDLDWNDIGTDKNEYFRQKGGNYEKLRNDLTEKELQQKNFAATRRFAIAIEKALRENPGELKRLLKKHAHNLLEENYAQHTDDGKPVAEGKQHINRDVMREYWRQRKNNTF